MELIQTRDARAENCDAPPAHARYSAKQNPLSSGIGLQGAGADLNREASGDLGPEYA